MSAQLALITNNYKKALASGADNKAAAYLKQLTGIKTKLNSGNYWSGGFTGRGGKYEEAGTVHRGEIVIPQEHVNQSTGMPNMSALGFLFKGMSMPPKSSASSSGSNNSIQLVELLPNQLARLEKAMNVLVNLDLETITNGVNAQNAQNNMRGAR